jgi:hypothetical protein
MASPAPRGFSSPAFRYRVLPTITVLIALSTNLIISENLYVTRLKDKSGAKFNQSALPASIDSMKQDIHDMLDKMMEQAVSLAVSSQPNEMGSGLRGAVEYDQLPLGNSNYSLDLDHNCHWCSRLTCVGVAGVNQSCQGFNLYQKDHGSFLYLRRPFDPPLQELVPLRALSTWGGPSYLSDPIHEAVLNETQGNFFWDNLVAVHQTGHPTIAQFVMWTQNMAHALVDSLYPAFVAAVKFGYAFKPFWLLRNAECNKEATQNCRHEGAMEAFAAYDFRSDAHASLLLPNEINTGELQQSTSLNIGSGKWVHFEQVIMGSTYGGEYSSVDLLPFATLPGRSWLEKKEPNSIEQKEKDLLLIFQERMMHAHQVTPREHFAAEDLLQKNRPIRVLFTESKRFTGEQDQTLQEIAQQLSHVVVGNESHIPINASYINWGQFSTYREQIDAINQADILFTSRGTSMFWCIFLRPGSSCVLLGTAENLNPPSDCNYHQPWNESHTYCPPSDQEQDPVNLPHYGEESIVASNRYIHILHLPLMAVTRGWTEFDLKSLLDEAVNAVLSSKDGMFPIDRSHPTSTGFSIIGKIFRELLAKSPSSHEGLSPTHKYAWDCHQRNGGQANFADIVYERPQTVDACQIDVKTLREIKQKFKFAEHLGVTEKCECVVCIDCGNPFEPQPNPTDV